MGPSLNRNRFSAVATISVPTLGIKGKKIGKKEKYVETISPAPSTPAGEPLGEIEVEVSEEVAQRLRKGWSVEVTKAEEAPSPCPALPPLLETTFPKELPPPNLVAAISSLPPEIPQPETSSQTPPQEPRIHTLSESQPSAATSKALPEQFESPTQEVGSNDSTCNAIKQSPPAAVTPAEELAFPVASEMVDSLSSPQSERSEQSFESLPEPSLSSPPSLFRSRAFAALIDVSVACSFFVLGLLLFPEPPRIIPFVLGALYLLTKDSLGILNGQSIGKKLMKLRVLNRNRRSLSGNYRTGLMRNLSWFAAPLEFAILYVREDECNRGRRLGDDWANTTVVPEEKPVLRKSKWLP